MEDIPEISSPQQKNRPPILIALGCLIVAGGICFGLILLLSRTTGLEIPFPITLAGAGLVSAALGHVFGLARWWVPILLLLPAALAGSLYFSIPSWVYLVCFILLVIVYWNAAGERVPLYLSNAKTWAAVDTLLPGEAKTFVDLGSGLGGMVIYLGRKRPEITCVGIESAPVPYLISKIRVSLLGLRNVDIRFGDIWSENLGAYDGVYAFLSPEPMERLFQKVEGEMQAGSRFISNSFTVPSSEPDETFQVDDSRETRLLIWNRQI